MLQKISTGTNENMSRNPDMIFSIIVISAALLITPMNSLSQIGYTLKTVLIRDVTAEDIETTLFDSAKDYLLEQKYRRAYPIIENIDEYLSQYALRHCLIVIDNPRLVHIIADKVTNPLVLRSIIPLALEYPRTADLTKAYLVYGPINFAPRNVTEESYRMIDCPISRFLTEMGDNMYTFCYRINFFTYFLHAKPKTCYVYMVLHPPKFYFMEHPFGLETRIHRVAYQHRVFPSLFPPTTFVYVNEINKTVGHARDIIRMLHRKAAGLHYTSLFCEVIFLHFQVKPREGLIYFVELLRMCPYWEHKGIQILPASMSATYESLLDASMPPRYSHLRWNIMKSAFKESVMGHMMEILQNSTSPLRSSSWFSRSVERVGRAYAYIWFTIMENFTVLHGFPRSDLSNQRIYPVETRTGGYFPVDISLELSPHIRGLTHFPYFVSDTVINLKFVSCGKRGLESIHFEEVTNAFDKRVWVLILASTLLLMIYMNFYLAASNSTQGSCWLSPIKVLLEQGTPFQGTLVKNENTLRFVVGLFLLMGIVLSNAYKNRNVYNMITPRSPIPYEKFRELLQDNFTIYTRVVSLQLSKSTLEIPRNIDAAKSAKADFIIMEEDSFRISALSEIAAISIVIDDLKSFNQTWISKSGVVTAAKLQPFANKSMKIVLSRYKKLMGHVNKPIPRKKLYQSLADAIKQRGKPKSNMSLEEFEQQERKSLMKNESRILLQLLTNCNKVAVILPEFMCNKFYQIVKKNKKSAHVFVGKESYSEIDWAFTLKGMLSKNLLQRVKGIHEAGIWERWSKLVRGGSSTPNHFGKQEVNAASVDGNVVLIFLLWCVGIAGALTSFLLEILCRLQDNVFIQCVFKNARFPNHNQRTYQIKNTDSKSMYVCASVKQVGI